MSDITRNQLLNAAKRLQANLLSLRVVASGEPCFASITPKAFGKNFADLTASDIGRWQIRNLKPIDNQSENSLNPARRHYMRKFSRHVVMQAAFF